MCSSDLRWPRPLQPHLATTSGRAARRRPRHPLRRASPHPVVALSCPGERRNVVDVHDRSRAAASSSSPVTPTPAGKNPSIWTDRSRSNGPDLIILIRTGTLTCQLSQRHVVAQSAPRRIQSAAQSARGFSVISK